MRICVIGDLQSVHVVTRAEALAERGHAVIVITPNRQKECSLQQASPRDWNIKGGNFRFGELRRLIHYYSLIRKFSADTIHIHYAASVGAWLSLIAGRREPTVVSTMGGDILDNEQTPLPLAARWMTRQVLRRGDLVTAKSDYMVSILRSLGISRERILKVIWGVDLAQFRPVSGDEMRRSLGLDSEHRVILSPRILRPFYNLHQIVASLPHIVKKVPSARLVLTEVDADPRYRNALVQQAREIGVEESIVWAGVIPYHRMPELYGLSEVIVGVPLSDGFPQSVIESLACGVPAVVSRVAAYEELLDDGNNALFTDVEPEAISDAVLRVFNDDALVERLKNKGIETVARFANLENDIARVDAAFRGLLTGARKPRAALWVRAVCGIILTGLALRNDIRIMTGASS